MKCVNIATKEFKELAKSNNVDLGTLEMIVHKYWAETKEDTVFPTSVYIQAQLGNVKYVESGENVRELWETQYKEPKQFSTLEKVQQAANEALKFFPEDAVTYHKTADGKYILSVKQPVKSLSTSTKEVLKDSSLKNTEHFGEVSSTATRELLENIANSNRRQFLFMEEEEVKSKIADFLQKSRIPRRTAKRLTDNIEKMSKKGILEELSILEREQRDFELIARNLGSKEKEDTSNTEEEAQFAVETKHSFTFNDGTTISTPFELNSEQKDALNAMDLFIHSRKPEDFSMTLSGYAGTGKTSIMEMLAEKARMDGIPIKFTASTNKASQVLKDRVMKRGFIAQTLHRLFNYRQQQDETKAYDAKETITVPGGRPKYFWGDIVVIDEASMIDDVLYQNLIEDAKNNNLKIIFVGDRAQLAPVNQATISKVFIDPDPNRKVVELFKVERTGDNAILEEATGLRNSQALTKRSKFNSKGQGVAYISSKNRTAIVDTIQHFLPHIKDNPDYFRILAWSNAAVSEHNETVRRLLGYSGKMPQVGEPMVGYTNWGWHEASDYESPYDLVNSEPYKVVNVGQPRTITKSFQRVSDGVMTTVQLQAIPLTLEDSTGERKQFNFIDVKSNAQNWAAAKQLALQKDALWKKYKTAPKGKKNIVGTKSWYRDQANQIEQFLFINDSIEIPDSTSRRGKRTLQSKVIDFGYAMTVHKSQGSTFTHVIMDDVNISQADQGEDNSPTLGNVVSADAQLANAEFEAVGPKKKTSFNFRAMAGLGPNTPETLIKEAPKVSPTRQAELANIRQQLKYVAMTRATDTVTVISENPISEDSVLNHLSNTQNTAPTTGRTPNSPSSSTNAMKMSSAQIWNYMSEVTSNMPSQTVPYTPKGKERQVYTVHDGHIFNKDGIEVFAGDSVDRNKILANLALKEGRAVEVTHKDHRYVVDGNKNITSVTTGKVMAWDYENGDRKAILGLAEQQFRSIIYNTQRSVSSQLVTQLKKLGFEVYGKEALEQYLKEHPNAMNQQALEEQKEMAEIKAKAIADGTFMKAPNGKPTNLNERQWLQVRTKAFKKWFGDWLTYQRIQNAKVIWGHPGTGKTWLFKQRRKDIIDFDSEYKAKLGDFREREVLKKEIGKEAYNQKLDELFEEARQEAIKSGRKLLVSDLHFLRDRADDLDLITNISNEEFIERSHQRGEHDEADKMEWKNSINAAMQNISSDKVIETSGYISDLMDGTNVSKVVDENGEPLVVYHGNRDPNIRKFEPGKGEFNNDPAYYFTPNYGIGYSYTNNEATKEEKATLEANMQDLLFLPERHIGQDRELGLRETSKQLDGLILGKVYPVFLNMRNPAYNVDRAIVVSGGTVYKRYHKKYDGVISEPIIDRYHDVSFYQDWEHNKYGAPQYVVFNPNQIKSATDNIGTFSTENDDIQSFTTPAGEVYGFVTKDGKIYLDETVISPEHPIHEYTHIWDRIVAQKNPKLWKRGVELMKELDLWKKIEENEHYGKKWIEKGITGERLENLIASEVHARLVGQEGEAILNKVAQKKGHEGIVDKLKSWMLDVWKVLKGTFSNWSDSEIAKLTLDDFKQMTIRDFADAVDLVNAPDVTTSSLENTTKAIEKSTNRVRDYYRWQRKHITFDKDSHTYFYDGMPIDYSVTEYKDYLYGKPNILGDYSHSREMGNSVDALTRDFFSKDKDPHNLSYPNLNEERKNQIIRDLERLKKFFDKEFNDNYKVITTEFPIAGKIKTPDGEKTVAGTIDMLIIDGEGNLHILDMKVKKNSIDAYNDRRDYTFQLNAYRQLLETIFPEFSGKIKDLNLIWFDTAYPRQGKEATFVTHDSGMVTVSDDKVTDLPLSEYDSWKTPSLKSNVEESLVPLERKNVLENVKSLKEGWEKENVEQLPSPQPGKALGEDAEIYSGAAEGSDTIWANKAKELGINVKEYTVKDWDKLPQTWKDKLDAEYIEVVRALKRLPYKRDSYKGKLVRRDMMQADKADAIFAIGHVVKPGEMGKQYTNNSNHDIVDGGTGYAVQRGIIRGIPVYVFDQVDGRWKVWDKESSSFVTTSEPALTPHAATIGTREIEENGKQAIESVLNKIPRTVDRISAVQKVVDKYHSTFTDFSKYGDAPIIVVDSSTMSDEELERWYKSLGEAYTLDGKDKKVKTAKEIREYLKESGTKAYHIHDSRETHAIFIDAAYITPEEVEETVFHENIHRVIRNLKRADTTDILKAFWDNSEDELFKLNLKIAYGIDEANLYNEYFTHQLGRALADRNIQPLLSRLTPEGKMLLNEILCDLGYISIEERNANKKTGEIATPEIEKANVQQQGQQPVSQVQQSIIQQHQGIWTRESVEKDPETLYIFTDNTDRDSGSGEVPADSWYAQRYGQGHHYPNATTARIRGLNNARPISTVKWFYRNHQGVSHPKYNRTSEALWHDKDFEEFKKVVDAEFADILEEWKTGKYKRIMFPQGDGLFNGEISAITKERTPKIYEYLQKKYQELQQQVQQVVSQPTKQTMPNQQPSQSAITSQESSVPSSDTEMDIWWGSGEKDPNRQNADLSNFAERPFDFETSLDDIPHFTSVEQAFQYHKLIEMYDEMDEDTFNEWEDKILNADAAEARRLGRRIPMSMGARARWDEKSSDIMKELLKASFEQNEEARKKLFETGNATLTHNYGTGKWKTEFPRLLMEVRDELREEYAEQAPYEVSTSSEVDESQAETPQETETTQNVETRIPVSLPNFANATGIQDDMVVDAQWKVAEMVTLDNEIKDENTDEENQELVNRILAVAKAKDKASYKRSITTQKKLGEHNRLNKGIDNLMKSRLLSSSEVRHAAEQVANYISYTITEIQKGDKTVQEVFPRLNSAFNGKGASRKDIVQNIGIDNFIQLAKDNIDPSVNMNITSRSLARQAQLLIDNWEALMTFATDTFVMNEGFGIRKDYTRKGFSVTESQHLTMEDLNQHNDVDSVREKEGDEQEHWQVEFRTVDAINSMSELVRIAFHECYLIDPNKEGEDKRIMSKWNIPERVDMKEAVQSVLKWTQGALTLDEMVNKMREHINEAPWLEQMIKRLSDESGAETDFQSQFFGVMNRHFQLYSIVRNKNGKFVSQIINEKPALLKLTRTVESKYKMGEHPLLSSTGINASSLEALRKTLSELETLKAALEEYEKQHLDEKAELSSEDRVTAFKNLSAMSKLLGFDIPNEIWDRVINVDNIKEMTKYLRYIVNSLDKVISSKQENYDPFKFKGLNSIGGTLQNLMTPVADIMENTGVSSFFDDGKMYQSYVTPSWMTKLMKKFKGNDKDVVDFIMREYGNSEWFKEQIDSYEGWKSGWRNKWLERLINDPAAREIFAHKVELNFNKHNYMRTMTDTEYALSLVTEFFAEASKDKDGRMPAWFRIPMLSNKPSSEFIRQYAYTGMEYKEAITEDLFGIYLQELMRIQTVIRRNKKEGDPGFIKNFDTNGRKFCFLPFLNKEMENNTRLGYLLNEKIKSEGEFEHEAELEKLVTKAIKDHMDERVKKIMAEWKQKGILKAAEKIDGIGRGEQKVAENIEKFLWNDHLASMNILQLTIGDIAFYKDAEDLQKRLAQIHAPGTRANIRARDYETGEFVSDGTYRTIILKDFDGFKSNIIANITEVFDRKIARAKNDAERKSLEVLKDYLVRPRTYKEDGTIDDEGGEYWKINVADAQGYSSPSSYRKKALMFGRWSREAEKIFKRLQHNDYDMTQLKTVFQPLKPFVYSRIEKTIAGKESPIQKIYAPFQAKNAEYLLVMAGAIIEGEEAESGRLGRPNLLKAIHRIMEESESLKPGKGIDTVQFESAIKSSLQTPIDIQQFAEDPNGEERAYQHMKNLIFMNEKDGEGNRIYVNYNNSEYVHEASYEDYCLQQEVPEHFKDHDQAHGSQIRMIMPADLDLYYDYNKKEGREDESNKVYYEWTEPGGKEMKVSATEYKKLYEETISANIEDSLDELAKELHLDTKDIKERNAILSDFLQREIVDSPRYGIDLFQACSLNENGEFRIPKGDPIQAKRIEQLINSLIKNRVNKQTIPGGPVVQVTNFGTSRQLHIRFKDKSKEGALIPLEEEYNPAEHGGKSYKDYCKDNQGGIAYFEVFAPIPSEDWIEKFGNPDGTIDIAAIEKIDPKLLEMVSYRIPTEDKYSCAPMKIVGFLPRQAGEAIMLPYELTTIDGSDFDVDKRYIMRRDIDIVVDKDKVRKYLFNKTTLGWEKSGRKLNFAAKNKLRDEINIFLDNPEKMKDFDAFNLALYAEYKKYIKEGRPYKASYPKEARRVRNNRIIDMSWAVLTHEMTADKILNPGNFEQQKEVGYRISAFKNPANRTKNWEDLIGKDSKALKKLSYVEKDLTWVDTQLQFYHQNNAGSSLIGVFAVNKVAHATLGEDKIFADIKEICGDNPLKIAGFEFKSRMEVDPMYDKKGNLIGKTLGSLVAASADTAKDPVLDLMNINMSTAGMLTSLLRLGMPFEDAAIFLSQDIITEVLEEMNIRRLQGQDSSLESIVHSKKKEIVDEIKEFDPEFKIGPDDNIHKEEITRQELINGLRKGSSLATQYKVLEALVRVKALADSMRNLTFATRFNSISSAVGPLIIDNIILEHKMDNLRLGPGKSSTGFYYEGGRVVTIDNIFEKHPILGSFGKTVGLAKNLFMDMPAGSTGFRNLLNTLQFRFGDKFAEKFYKDRKLMDAFSMFYQSYILVQEGLINPRDCEYYVNQFPHVFYSKDYKSKYPDNALIQAIDLTLSERTGRAFLNISISGMSTTEKERLSNAWYDLQKVDPQLSKDLFNYCFFRAGIGFSPKSFMSLLNTYVKEELQSSKEYAEPVSYIDIFRKLPSIKDPEFLIELFVRNNWNYPRLVKTAGGENTNYKYYDDHLIVDSDSDMMALKGAPFIKIKNDGEDTYTLWQLLGKEKDNKERRYYVKIAALGENGEFLQILPTNGENGKPIVESQSDIINSLPMEDPNNSDLAFFMESDPETFEDMEDDVEIEPTVTEEAKEIAEEAEVLLRDAFDIKESTHNSKKDNSKLTISRFKEFVDDAFERLGITMDEERAKEETDKYC